MSKDQLSLEEVRIVRAPGFETGGFPVENLSSGVNIIHGPNASGKTTAARAIQDLLWPSEARDQASIVGGFSLDGEAWRVEVDSRRATYQRNGQEAGAPGLPPAGQRDRYHLALHDLLQEDTRDRSFAEAIMRESAGGYDVAQAADALSFTDSPTSRQKKEVKQATNAQKAWREAQEAVEDIRAEEKLLPELERELEKTRQAKTLLDLLDRAGDYAKARDVLETGQAQLDPYPEIIEHIGGDEASQVDDLDRRIERWQQKLEDAESAKTEAKADLEAAELPDDGVPEGFIERLKQRRDNLSKLESKRRDLEASLADARGRCRNAEADLPDDVDPDDLKALEPVTWGELSNFAKNAERIHADREAYQAAERWLTGGETPDEDLETLQRGRQALENWLQESPERAVADGGRLRTLSIVSALLIAGASVALGVFVHPAFYLGVLAPAGILWYGFRRPAAEPSGGNPRAVHQRTAEQLNLRSPSSWEPEAVRARLAEIQEAIAKHKLAEERRQRLQALQDDAGKLEAQERELEQTRKELQERFGVAPDTTEIELFMLAQAASRWQQAHDDIVAAEAQIQEVEGQICTAREDLSEDLAPYGSEPIEDAAEATHYIRDIESRARKHDDAEAELTRAEGTIEEAGEKIEELRSDREAEFTEVGLEPTEYDRLVKLCDQADDYKTAAKAVNDAKLVLKEKADRLHEAPGYEPELKEKAVPELEQAKREAKETADRYEDVLQEKNEIEGDIKRAKQDYVVEDALADKERALDELEGVLEDDYAVMIGHVLTEYVREVTTEASRPEVFHYASDVLEDITNDRYKLDLEEDGTTFRAYDTVKEKGFAFDALSSATRLQVLLAVRIAFIEQQEKGIKLPLVLDETLANTDDTKARVIIRSAIDLTRDGRQIFYFTAQGDEVAKWLAELEDQDVDHTVIDLAEIQGLGEHVTIPDLSEVRVHTRIPPDPAGHDHASYGQVFGVDPFNPREGAGSAHLWYLVDDIELLHHLLSLGIERWGQLNNLLERGGGDLVTDDQGTLEELRRQGLALSAFVRAWRQGRGDPVDRQALESSGAVSERFIDDVTELAKDVGGDAESIIEALRARQVHRFHTPQMDELEAYFEENSYIDAAEPLEPEQVRMRLMQRLTGAGVPRDEAAAEADALLERLSAAGPGSASGDGWG